MRSVPKETQERKTNIIFPSWSSLCVEVSDHFVHQYSKWWSMVRKKGPQKRMGLDSEVKSVLSKEDGIDTETK